MVATLLFALALNIAMFFIAFRNKTDKLTDISYAVTFIGIVLFGAFQNELDTAQYIVTALVLLWAIRLGSYLLIRIHFMGRDKRFDGMRESFWKFGRFWVLQAITAWVVMVPASYLLQSERDTQLTFIVILGTLVSFSGICIEALADKQKFAFIREPKNKNKWIEEGLWKYSRHPNYLGEMMMWYGIYIVSYPWLSTQNALIALIGPIFISFMLIGVSGIPLLEKSADARWGSDKKYQEYKRQTSVLLLLPRKK